MVFPQSIDYSVSLNYAVLDYAVRYRDELLYNIYKMGRNSIDRGSRDNWTLSPKRIAEMGQLYADAPKTGGTRTGTRQGLAGARPAGAILPGKPADPNAWGLILPGKQRCGAEGCRLRNGRREFHV